MKQFFLRLMALVGLIMTVTMISGGLIAWHFVGGSGEEEEIPDNIILSMDFTAPISEPLSGFDRSLAQALYEDEPATPLLYFLRALHYAKNDPRVKGIAARFGSQGLALVHTQELAKAIDDFRSGGKFSYAYAASYGDFVPGGSLYALASHFENRILQPVGSVSLGSLGIESPFGKSALAKWGVQTDFMRREEYKSVMENVSRDSFSPPVRANMESMLGSLSDQIAQAIAGGLKIDLAKAKEIVANGPYTSSEALKLGLVSKLAYEDEAEKEMKDKGGKDVAFLDPQTYIYYHMKELDEKKTKKERKAEKKRGQIALIFANGMIVENAPSGPSSLTQEEVIDTQTLVEAIQDAAEDKHVKALLIRVNSPGGSPVASETIRRAIVKAKESKKPVFVSMGQVAGSGGYWIAMNADKIYADPATMTGSIGVVAGKFVLGGLFDKLGVKWDTIATDKNAALWSMRLPFDAKGRERMNAMLDETYKTFTDNVAAARKIPQEKMPEIAKGRVYTGEQAVKVGLVDELGGLNEALIGIKKELKIDPEAQMYLQQFPAPETPQSFVMKLLRNFMLNGAFMRSGLGDLHKVTSALSPYLDGLTDESLISAKMPSSYLPRL